MSAGPHSRRIATGFAREAWQELAGGANGEASRFDPMTLDDLPAPARRLLVRALPDGVPLASTVQLTMEGEIKLGGRWLRFSAQQILRAGAGFVWAPTVGGPILRFVGADVLTPGQERMEFRLWGLLPVVRATGSDVRRSARGRLAAETVAWLPQALTPQMGARWRGTDNDRAIVTLDAAGEDVDVEVAVNGTGDLEWLGLQRWNDSAKPPAYEPFGGAVSSALTTAEGVRIAAAGTVGWGWHTAGQAGGEFFRYRVTAGAFAG